MRWIWIDRFTAFEPGRRAVAVKCVTLAEEHLHDHVPGYPVHPPTLMIEGMAQTAGVLVGDAFDFAEKVILAKVTRATFHGRVRPGDRIRFDAEVQGEVRREGAAVTGRITADDRLVAEIELMFAHLDASRAPAEPGEGNFVFNEDFIRLLRMRSLRNLGADAPSPDA